ncbi:hypothetical protein [Burkholderia gladioli]|uniref:hypothetical protein n=1 Tax=Burkholderia gladioli TaxID=28095 RepID=UPI001640DCF7|nr:hypothetical protein [Burkholderia gladioli]
MALGYLLSEKKRSKHDTQIRTVVFTLIPLEALEEWAVQMKHELIYLLAPNDPAEHAEIERLKSSSDR